MEANLLVPLMLAFLLSPSCFLAFSAMGFSIPETRGNVPDFNPETDDFVPADRYLSHDEMITWLQGIARRHSQVAKTYSIGKSEQGRDLLVLELSYSVGRGKRDLLMPMVKMVCYYFICTVK